MVLTLSTMLRHRKRTKWAETVNQKEQGEGASTRAVRRRTKATCLRLGDGRVLGKRSRRLNIRSSMVFGVHATYLENVLSEL